MAVALEKAMGRGGEGGRRREGRGSEKEEEGERKEGKES